MRVFIFANGVIQYPEQILTLIQPGDLLIAADGGSNHLHKLGLVPKVIIGDLDSLSPDVLAAFTPLGVQVLAAPAQKDETDLELALRYAVEQRPEEILLFGMFGGRWDMTLANLLILANPLLDGQVCRAVDGPQQMFLIRGGETRMIRGSAGDLVSIIPVSGAARGLFYTGLAYSMQDGEIPLGSPRGVSNFLVGEEAEITLRSGLAMCVVTRK